MVLVSMGQHDTGEVTTLLGEISDIGHNEIDARHILAPERHTEIDYDPGLLALAPYAVERQVHAELADSAERREYELVHATPHCQLGGANFRPPVPPDGASGNTSPALTVSIFPSAERSTSRPLASSISKRPTSTRSASITRTISPIPQAWASHARRV